MRDHMCVVMIWGFSIKSPAETQIWALMKCCFSLTEQTVGAPVAEICSGELASPLHHHQPVCPQFPLLHYDVIHCALSSQNALHETTEENNKSFLKIGLSYSPQGERSLAVIIMVWKGRKLLMVKQIGGWKVFLRTALATSQQESRQNRSQISTTW